MDAVLISTDTLKKLPTFIQGNVEDSILRAVVYRVQDRMISPILGRKLYERLIDGVKNNNLNADERLLLNTYIKDCMMAGCEYRAVKHTTDQIRNKSTGQTQDENLKPVEQSEAKILRDTLWGDFEHYKAVLICYLKENYLKFPQYYQEGEPGHCCCQDAPAPNRPYHKLYQL